jgi:hypothetical protein
MAAALLESTDENDDNGIDDVAVLAQLAGLEPCALSIMVLTGIDPLALDLAGRLAYASSGIVSCRGSPLKTNERWPPPWWLTSRCRLSKCATNSTIEATSSPQR